MANRDLSSPTPMPAILRYGIAVLSVAIAIGLDFFLLRQFEAVLTPFLFAVAATVWYAGTGPGVLAIVLSVLSLNHFFLRPVFSFSPIGYADLVYLTFCIFCALLVGWVSAVRRRTEQELRQIRDELEAKVLERTANLARSEAYLAQAQKLTHTGSWAWDPRSERVLYCSEEMFQIFGLDPRESLPSRENFRQQIHPEDRDWVKNKFEQSLRERADTFAEYRVLLSDGTIRHIGASGHPVLNEDGELIEFIGTATDVTERKRAEEGLRESEAKIRRLVDSNIIGIFIWDFDGRILEANEAFLDIVGYDHEDLVAGRIRWTDLTPSEWLDRDTQLIQEHKVTGTLHPFEKEYFRKDGSHVPVLIGVATFEESGNQGVAFVLDLTERKRAEQALVRSEAYLTETQKLTHTGSWAWDARSQKVLYCSQEMFRIYGLDPQVDLPTRKNFRQRVHPEDRNRTDERFLRVVNEKVDSFDEYRVVLPDGTVKHVVSSGHPVLDGNGEFIEFIGTATDVTERKRAEEALREREAKIRRLVDSNIIGIFITGREGRVLEANDAFLHLVGQDRDDLVSGRIRWTDLTPPEWRERDRRALAELSSNTIARPYEKEFFRKDGSRIPVLIGGALFEEGGDEGVAFVLDLTDRKCAEEALRESEYKLRQIIETVPGLLWSLAPDGEPTHFNQRFLDYFGKPFEDFKHGGLLALIHPDDFPETERIFSQAIQTGTSYQDLMRLRRADGEFRWYHVRGEPLRDRQGRIIQWYGLSVDIDEAKKAEDRLRRSESHLAQAQLELAHANRVATMGQLTASITHEVNQPITAAVTYASAARRLLSAEPPNLHEVDDVLSLIVKEGNRAGEVVGRIRALIKKAPARKDAVEINDAILEVIALTRTEAANNSVSVRTQLAEGLPRVQGDRVQLQQVLLNLIINAIEAMRDGGEAKRELLICTRNEPDGVLVEVRDSGPGFAPADTDRVFEAFYSTKPNGVGLGLSICRSIIEAHDGRLWASPNVPRGAAFGFIAPAYPAVAS
jgi:PAS domain S-box-containing protein